MDPANAAGAMERIIEGLTEPQQMALVASLRAAKEGAEVTVSANERTIGSLLKGDAPLIREADGRRRVLTGLGLDVARYLKETRSFNLPDLGSLVSGLPKVDGK
jgi:hypothetical protein